MKTTVTPITGGPLVGKITCKICGEVFTREAYLKNKCECLNEACMSRKQQRKHRQEMRAAAQAAQRVESTLAEISVVEKTHQFDALPYDNDLEGAQLYVDVPHVIERHISVKRIPV